ncbi:MAG: amidohydrolase family protein [Alphaproteobacteria bacterium]|nr:amidohydrolase family protein [Alphaproteobacteria bacterium]
MPAVTCIRQADWVVAWDAAAGAHRYRRSQDVAFDSDGVVFVGDRFTGTVDEEVDGRDVCVMPGLVNVHCHPTNQPITRGVREEMGNPKFYNSALYDRTGLWAADDDGMIAGGAVAFGELLKSGVTTVIDYAGRVPEGWMDLLTQTGMRIFAAPAFRDAEWEVVGESKLDFEWDEARGKAAMEEALALVEQASAHPSGLMSGVVAPAQVDTCTAATLQESYRIACDKGLMWQTHAAQSLTEIHEMTQRHGKTPVQWLDDLGVLGPRTTLGHCIFTDAHEWTHWPIKGDLETLARTGTTVAHCPVVFSRYGQTMQSLGGYMRAGINIGIGTDTAPHNMLEEMRQALILSRVASGDMYDIATTEVFNAATIGGAKAYGRDDIGRLAVGAKADLVLLDLTNRYMRPMRDPLRNLIYTAADRAVRDVYIGGAKVVGDGEVLTLDIPAAVDRLEAAQRRAEAGVADRDPEGRPPTEISPLVLEPE